MCNKSAAPARNAGISLNMTPLQSKSDGALTLVTGILVHCSGEPSSTSLADIAIRTSAYPSYNLLSALFYRYFPPNNACKQGYR